MTQTIRSAILQLLAAVGLAGGLHAQTLTDLAPATPPPGIGNVSFAGGQFVFNVSSPSGPDYTIETSTNIAQWNNAFITNSPALPFVWTDANPPAAPQRFYRLMLGPPPP